MTLVLAVVIIRCVVKATAICTHGKTMVPQPECMATTSLLVC